MAQIRLFDYEEPEVSPLRNYSKYQTWKWKRKKGIRIYTLFL